MKQVKKILIAALCISFSQGLSAQMTEAEGKAFTDFMTPGKIHAMMAKSDGDWKQSITFWMNPGAPPMQMNSTCHNEMVMGGRYQLSTSEGEMMGMPFKGQGLTGYDNVRNIFVTTWIDNMGTGIIYMEGKWNDATKAIEFAGKMTDPMAGKAIDARQVLTFMDDTHQKLEMFVMHGDQEFKSMEILISR